MLTEQVAYTLKGQYYEMILWPFKFLYYDTKEGRVRGSFCFEAKLGETEDIIFPASKHSRTIHLCLLYTVFEESTVWYYQTCSCPATVVLPLELLLCRVQLFPEGADLPAALLQPRLIPMP